MSRTLTTKEWRTIRIALAAVGLYLALFYGPSLWNYLSERREEYDKLVQQATELRDIIKPYEEKIETASNLMVRFQMDPAKLKRATLMAEASAAIQKAAASSGFGVGPIRETPGRPSAKEAGSIQFDGGGQISGVMAFLYQLDRVGYPVIVDSIQFSPTPGRPDTISVKMTVVVLDFEAWKPKEEQSHV